METPRIMPAAMAYGIKRALDYAAYAISAAVVGGGAVYAVHRLQSEPAPPPSMAAAPSAPASAPPPPVIATPAPVPVPASQPLPPAPAPSPPASAAAPTATLPDGIGVVTTASRTYLLPQPAHSSDQDRATYLALQRNCYAAADNNRNGQYPALQAAACNSYAQFAGEHGWNPGQMPPYGQATAAAPAYVETEPAYQDGAEMVVYDAAIGGYRRVHRQSRDGGTRRQIGPNYALPAPQTPPPVSQEQHRAVASRAAAYPQR